MSTPGPAEKVRHFGPFLAVRTRWSCQIFRTNETGVISALAISPEITEPCYESEFVWSYELNTTLLYTIEGSTNCFFRIRHHNNISDSFNRLTFNYSLTGTGLYMSFVTDHDHQLTYILNDRFVYRFDYQNASSPSLSHALSLKGSYRPFPPSPGMLIPGKLVVASLDGPFAVNLNESALIEERYNVSGVWRSVFGTEKYVYLISESTGSQMAVLSAASGEFVRGLYLGSDLKVADRIISGFCSQRLCIACVRNLSNRLAFFGIEANGNLTHLGQSPRTIVNLTTVLHFMHWVNDNVYVANWVSGIAFDKMSTIIRESNIKMTTIERYTTSLNGDVAYGYGTNPLRIHVSNRILSVSTLFPNVTFQLRIWDYSQNYTFIPKTFRLEMNFTEEIAKVSLINGSDRLSISNNEWYPTEYLTNSSSFLLSIASCWGVDTALVINVFGTDSRLGFVSDQILVGNRVDRVPSTMTTATQFMATATGTQRSHTTQVTDSEFKITSTYPQVSESVLENDVSTMFQLTDDTIFDFSATETQYTSMLESETSAESTDIPTASATEKGQLQKFVMKKYWPSLILFSSVGCVMIIGTMTIMLFVHKTIRARPPVRRFQAHFATF